MRKLISLMLILALLMPSAAAFETRDELRQAYRALGSYAGDTPYLTEPQTVAPYAAGEVDPLALDDALAYLNFLRQIAGVEPVTRSAVYDFRCQHGATLLAALGYVDHYAPKPADMDKNFYDSAHLATTSSNIAQLNWMRPTILREALAYFVRDDGDANLPVLGHRRWALNPTMNATGFGLANSEIGMSYIAMYAHDLGNPDAQWSQVCWPAGGAFPVELMHDDLAWSVVLNPEIYDVSLSEIEVRLLEPNLGLSFRFGAGDSDGFYTLDTGGYGAGPCVIFRPDFSDTDFTDYQQNQHWFVQIDGLALRNGERTKLYYQVDMTSLYAQDVANVELSEIELEMRPGETKQLFASVIPSYADDLKLSWRTSNLFVATVSAEGTVTAVAPGTCEIIAESANGRYDKCILTVASSLP